MKDDLKALTQITGKFFASFISSDLNPTDLSKLRKLFISEAIIVKTCGTAPIVYSVEEFIGPRQKILTDGTLLQFQERDRS